MRRRSEQCLVRTSSMPYCPPRSLLEELYRLDDGRLRLRWSEDKEKWAVERRVSRPVEYISSLPHWRRKKVGHDGVITVENDVWVRARDGYILIGHYAPQPLLSDWVIKNLQFYDIRRYRGGWREAELETIRAEEKRIEQKEKADSWRWREISEDFYTREQWRQGEKAAVPANYQG